MTIFNGLNLFFMICQPRIAIFSGCGSTNININTGNIIEEEYINWCGQYTVRLDVPDTKIEIISFLSVDPLRVEQLPSIVGGTDYLLSRIMYPEIARRAGVEGIVIIEFTIDSLGNAKNYKIIKGISAGCDDAVIGALIFDLKYLPAIKDDKETSLLMRVAVIFSLIYH